MNTTVEDLDRWEVSNQVSRAYKRSKERILNFLAATFLMWIGSIAIAIVFCTIGFVIGYITYQQQNWTLFTIGVSIVVFFGTTALVYFATWIHLAIIKLITQKEKLSLSVTLSETRPLINKYLSFQLLATLFMLGLIPLIFLSLGIVGFVWAYWGAFASFIFLEKQKKGMENFWYSKAVVSQRFWPVVGRLFFASAAVGTIYSILGNLHVAILSFIGFVIAVISPIFLLSFYYEVYSDLPEPEEKLVKKPQGWIALSIIGGILTVLFIASIVTSIVSNWATFSDEFRKGFQEGMQQRPQYNQDGFVYPTSSPSDPADFDYSDDSR